MQENWPSTKVRETFLEFFEKKNHRRLPSFPLVPIQDPTLLLVAAGMAPFKAEFAGLVKPVAPRITTCQKCVRADDLEQVGRTSRHHTFFEMLGNFSFGDYFKEEAIVWGWELLTQHYQLSKEKLWVSVHTDDDEAYQIWNKKIGLPTSKLIRLADNFWGPIGPTGTCGPDSEIYYDRGEKYSCRKSDCRPGCENKNDRGESCDRFLELWNLVFTMYHKDEQGKLHELPQKNIDTGAGLERITMVLQGKDSPFETDLFKNLIEKINPHYEGSSDKARIASRIVADHIRAATFIIADNVLPSNEGRGYVLRRILRRARLYADEAGSPSSRCPSLSSLARIVIETMKNIYPELSKSQNEIEEQIALADDDFLRTLNLGHELLREEIAAVKSAGKTKLPGEVLFRLHDERGFPFELAKDIIVKEGLEVDEQGFLAEMAKQRERSRGTKAVTDVMAQALQTQLTNLPATIFLGYEHLEGEIKVLAIQNGDQTLEGLREGEEGIVVFDQSPFYAESGGQIGDTGALTWNGGRATVLDTQKSPGAIFFHRIQVKEGRLSSQASVHGEVDRSRREQIRRHHTATHMLHSALREILGPHVQQAGSYVSPEYLRLDFSHPKSLTEEELSRIETLVNEKISLNLSVQTKITSQEEAIREGALALFGEKYGDEVRIVQVNKFSKELCGGTHASRTGDLGLFVITKESSIAKGVRRIEAKTAKAGIAYLEELQSLRIGLTDRLKAEFSDLLPGIDLILTDKQEKEKEILRLKRQLAAHQALSLLSKVQTIGDIPVLLHTFENEDGQSLKNMADALKDKMKSGIVFLSSSLGGKVSLVCGVTPDLLKRGFSAVELVKSAAAVVGGGGGGRNDLAEAGGKDPAKIGGALDKVIEMIQSKSKKTSSVQ